MLMQKNTKILLVVFLANIFLAGSVFAMRGSIRSSNHGISRHNSRLSQNSNFRTGNNSRRMTVTHNDGRLRKTTSGHLRNSGKSHLHNKNAHLFVNKRHDSLRNRHISKRQNNRRLNSNFGQHDRFSRHDRTFFNNSTRQHRNGPARRHYRYSRSFTNIYPYYYRNRIYVGLGSYRPYYDSYGYQPYYYGTYPETSQRVTNNYYGYPYEKQPKAADSVTPGYDSFSDSYSKPQQNTRAGIYFDKGISEFITGRYEQAAKDFKQASHHDQESPFLSFAHIQALVAGGYYYEASQFLRTSLNKLSPQNDGVFFPHGLYSDEALLNEHIEKLKRIVADNPGRTELHLLLGYQLLGIGEYDEALENLQKAEHSYTNKEAASRLIEILQKVRN